MITHFVNRKEELVYRFDGPTPELMDLPGSLRYLRLTDDAVTHYFSQRIEDRHRKETYLKFLGRGCVGMLIADDDTWASVGWISHAASAPPPHLTRGIIGETRLWSFYVRTREEYRGMGLQKAGLRFRIVLAREVAEDPSSPVFTDVSPTNSPSRRAKLSIGFKPAGRIVVRRLRVPKLYERTWGSWDAEAPHPPLVES